MCIPLSPPRDCARIPISGRPVRVFAQSRATTIAAERTHSNLIFPIVHLQREARGVVQLAQPLQNQYYLSSIVDRKATKNLMSALEVLTLRLQVICPLYGTTGQITMTPQR
jgi:hypothetical protein